MGRSFKKELDVNTVLGKFESSIKELDHKKQQKLLDWINNWSDYLKDEDAFDSSELVYYKRGLIVFADFGFKAKNELGGRHYAVVVENDNNKTNGTVTVIPLRSLKEDEGETEETIDKKYELYLGEGVIKFNPEFKTIAKVNQICALSKMRIYRPKYKKHGKTYMDGKYLEMIDEKIKEIYTYSKNKVENVVKKVTM